MHQQMATEWTGQKVRDTFVEFYKSKAHTHVPSSSVVPHDVRWYG